MKTPVCRLALTLVLLFGAGSVDARQEPVLSLVGELVPDQLPAGVRFGLQEDGIDVFGDRAVVTAGISAVGEDEGRAFVFDISTPGNAVQIAELRASDSRAGNGFGRCTAITDRYVFVGAYGDDASRGAVYMYDISDPARITERKIVAFDAAPQNCFGRALAVSGDRLIVGAPKFTALSLPTFTWSEWCEFGGMCKTS
jgi:hypothetical protein